MLRRRLAPLYSAAFLQNLALWVPIEKLFMTTIGFNAASVAWLVAAAIVACCVVLAVSHLALLVVGVQVLLTLLVVAVSIPVMRRLHDAVRRPSAPAWPRASCGYLLEGV